MDEQGKNKPEGEYVNPWKASDYLEKWNPNAYLNFFNMNENSVVLPLLHFQVSNVINVLNRHLVKKQRRVLEFGAGPCLWASLLFAEHFDEIWFCDFAPSNLKSVQDWLDAKADAFDWKPVFNYVLDLKESHHDNELEHEIRLRSALKNIFRCDVNGERSLFIDCPHTDHEQQQFDMIYSGFCLESACSTYEIFRRTISRFTDLLAPGGMLLVCSFRNSTSYTFNGQTFPDLPLDEETVRAAFVQTGHLTEPVFITLEAEPNLVHGITNHGIMIYYGFKK